MQRGDFNIQNDDGSSCGKNIFNVHFHTIFEEKTVFSVFHPQHSVKSSLEEKPSTTVIAEALRSIIIFNDSNISRNYRQFFIVVGTVVLFTVYGLRKTF